MSKVALIRCESYDTEKVYEAVKKGIELVGGIEKFVKKGEKVLLKPNLLRGHSPEKHATTHPAVFEAAVRILKENGYTVSYGDSPGIGSPASVAKAAGLDSVAQKYSIPLAQFESGKVISYPEGKKSKQFEIADGVLETDAIISLPKMKSHQFTRITGAVKNQLGCVYGLNKAAFHIKFPSAVDFSVMLTDLNRLLKVRLFIMDGITAMEGNGPASGTPRQMNCIIVSNDPVAIDALFCKLVNIPPEYIPFVTYGEATGLGNYTNMEVVGDEIGTFVNKDFAVVRTPVRDETIFGFLKPLKNLAIRRPYIDKNICKKCGICVEACPVEGKAITQKNKKETPVYDYNKCIRCYCCQEMCPFEAIKVKIPILGKILFYRSK